MAKKVLKPIKRQLKPLNIKISKNFKWMEKYIRRAMKNMPNLIMPKYIRSYRPPLNREMRVLGTCAVETRVITLSTHRISTTKTGKRRHVRIPQRHLLMTLAHEIAHFIHAFHDYEQESFARTIFQAFGLKDRCPHCAATGFVPARYIN
jgi:hypothetical protein